MKDKAKKISAAIAAVTQHLQVEQANAALQNSLYYAGMHPYSPRPAGCRTMWGYENRRDMMMGRVTLQMRELK